MLEIRGDKVARGVEGLIRLSKGVDSMTKNSKGKGNAIG
jgi:hypothetical protein